MSLSRKWLNDKYVILCRNSCLSVAILIQNKYKEKYTSDMKGHYEDSGIDKKTMHAMKARRLASDVSALITWTKIKCRRWFNFLLTGGESDWICNSLFQNVLYATDTKTRSLINKTLSKSKGSTRTKLRSLRATEAKGSWIHWKMWVPSNLIPELVQQENWKDFSQLHLYCKCIAEELQATYWPSEVQSCDGHTGDHPGKKKRSAHQQCQ